MSTNNERMSSTFWGALGAIFFTTVVFTVAIWIHEPNLREEVRALGVPEPDFVAVSTANRGTQYTVDRTSKTCYVMFTNAMGTSFAPVDCDAIGVDPYSVPRTNH